MSNHRHVSAEDLQLYVMGALDAGVAREVEHSASICDACEASLRREARLELQLIELGPQLVRRSNTPRRKVLRVAIVASALAAVFAFVLLRNPLGNSPSPDAQVTFDAAAHALASIENAADLSARNDALDQALAQGFAVITPTAVVVPRYEDTGETQNMESTP